MKIPRQAFVMVGAAAVLAAVALAGTSIAITGGNSAVHAVGDSTPTPDPTPDPCIDVVSDTGSELVMLAQQDPCLTATEETAPKTHTPTPEGTSEPTEPAATEPASTTVPSTPIPAVTSTPSGGAGAGGLQPPSTGSNGDAAASNANWFVIAAGLALAIGGTSALGYGLRKN